MLVSEWPQATPILAIRLAGSGELRMGDASVRPEDMRPHGLGHKDVRRRPEAAGPLC